MAIGMGSGWMRRSRSAKCLLMQGLAVTGTLILSTSCQVVPPGEAQPQPGQGQRPGGRENQPPAVDVAIAKTAPLETGQEYTGTTRPYREVLLRSQIQGQILDVTADVGDRVQRGQALARLDDRLLTAAVAEAMAEVAARESEVASLRAEVDSARTEVEEARLELEQAIADAEREEQLSREGATSEQSAQRARTAVNTARQAMRSAEQQVRNRQQAVVAAQRRVTVQRALVEQERQRQSFTVVTAPVSGAVLERLAEPGELAEPGSEILRVGDFSQVKVEVQVSERELAEIRVGQAVRVKLDAVGDRELVGQVTRISPAADPVARLVPVEVTIPNEDGTIGSGLLARVNFDASTAQQVVVPETAIEVEVATEQSGPPGTAGGGQPPQRQSAAEESPAGRSTVFVIEQSGEQSIARVRPVQLGDREDNQIVIVSGLNPGESYVVRSDAPLKDGAPVRLSFISERSQ